MYPIIRSHMLPPPPAHQAIDNNRHAVLMTLVVGSLQLVQMKKLENPAQVCEVKRLLRC